MIKYRLASVFVNLFLITTLSAQIYPNVPVSPVFIDNPKSVLKTYSASLNIPSQTALNRLNQFVHYNTDSIVQEIIFEIDNDPEKESLVLYEGQKMSFRTDLGLDIPIGVGQRTILKGTYNNNTEGYPDSLIVNIKNYCDGSDFEPQAKFYYNYNSENQIDLIWLQRNYKTRSYVSGCNVFLPEDFFSSGKEEHRIYRYEGDTLLATHKELQEFYHFFTKDDVSRTVYRRDSLAHSYPRRIDEYTNTFTFDEEGRVLVWTNDFWDSKKETWVPTYKDSYSYLKSTAYDYVRNFEVYFSDVDVWLEVRRDSSFYHVDENMIERKYYAIDPTTQDWYCMSKVKHYLSGSVKNVNKASSPLKNINVYPNPCNTGAVKIEHKGLEHLRKVDVIDVYGTIKYTQEVRKNDVIQLDLNHLKNGVYIVLLSRENGEQEQQKLIVNK